MTADRFSFAEAKAKVLVNISVRVCRCAVNASSMHHLIRTGTDTRTLTHIFLFETLKGNTSLVECGKLAAVNLDVLPDVRFTYGCIHYYNGNCFICHLTTVLPTSVTLSGLTEQTDSLH